MTETPPDVASFLVDAIEASLLGGPRKYTRADVARLTGFDSDRSRQLWRSMGFAEVGEDAVVFTDADVDEIKRVASLQSEKLIDDELFLATTRFIGQTFAQLASWEGELALDRVLAQFGSGQTLELAETMDFANRLVPLLEQTHAYVWRRQMASFLARKISQAQSLQGDIDHAVVSVGFADISGYTSLTRTLNDPELHRLLETFEATATYVVGEHGGRIVKMIGDAVLFSADSPVAGADIGLGLVSAWAALSDEDVHPDIKVGVAAGPVVNRLGDVFGSTVNIAARLTSISRPGWVLVDRTMSEELKDNPAYRLRSQRPQEVRGFNRLYSWRLQPPEVETPPEVEREPREKDRGREDRRRRRRSVEASQPPHD